MDPSFTKVDNKIKILWRSTLPKKISLGYCQHIVKILYIYCKDIVEVNSHEMINFRFGPDGRDVSLGPLQKMTEKGETIQRKIFK